VGLDLVGDVGAGDFRRPDGLVDVTGGLAEAEFAHALSDGVVRVGEVHLHLAVVSQFPVVRDAGDERARFEGELLDAGGRDWFAVAVDVDDDDGVGQVVLPDGLADAGDALVFGKFDLAEDELCAYRARAGLSGRRRRR